VLSGPFVIASTSVIEPMLAGNSGHGDERTSGALKASLRDPHGRPMPMPRSVFVPAVALSLGSQCYLAFFVARHQSHPPTALRQGLSHGTNPFRHHRRLALGTVDVRGGRLGRVGFLQEVRGRPTAFVRVFLQSASRQITTG
jgi:hypothetical protein